MAYTFHYQIGRMSNTRSTSYTWTAVKAVLDRNNLAYEITIAGMLADVEFSIKDKADAVAFRTKFERELKTVHRNIMYRVDITPC